MGWARKNTEKREEVIIASIPEISVRHVIEKKPDPRPLRGWFTFTDAQDGRQYRTTPFSINGRSGMVVIVPRAYITGDHTDHEQIKIQLDLEY